MKKILTAIVLIVSITSAQKYDNYIKGRITEKQTGRPIPGVNVYLNDTMFGTTTNESGYFTINSIIPGSHELVASMIGYNVLTMSIVIKSDSKISEMITLTEHVYEFGMVEVTAEESSVWQANYRKFARIFLGCTELANECEIINKFQIDFEDRGQLFIARAKAPLTIENRALGYTITCDLLLFQYDDATKNCKYVIKTYFKEMNSDKENVVDEYVTKRNYAYYGSLQHFLTSLIKKNVINEGYQIRNISVPTTETNYPPGFRTVLVDDIVKPGELGLYKKLSFDNYLQVKYEDPSKDIYETSYLTLNFPEINLDEFGIPLEVLPFKTLGVWAADGLADMLPKYFSPGNL